MMHRILQSRIRRAWRTLRATQLPRRRSGGQAIVELALALTFLAYLFAAAVDLGLAYKAYQTLINATAEASGSLKVDPLISCGTAASPPCDPAKLADSQARIRFRGEQGNQMGGMANTMDLNANGRDDRIDYPNDTNWINYIESQVRIDPADQSQVTTTNSEFAVNGSFTASNRRECVNRKSVYYEGAQLRQCFLVVRTQILYKPFAIAPFVGDTMTIRAISVVPIVGMN